MKIFLTKEEMQRLPTKRLLAYKNSIMKWHETSNWDDPTGSKLDEVWKKAHQDLKEVLSTREHIA
jgi:hypothetical protein